MEQICKDILLSRIKKDVKQDIADLPGTCERRIFVVLNINGLCKGFYINSLVEFDFDFIANSIDAIANKKLLVKVTISELGIEIRREYQPNQEEVEIRYFKIKYFSKDEDSRIDSKLVKKWSKEIGP